MSSVEDNLSLSFAIPRPSTAAAALRITIQEIQIGKLRIRS
jgi:hypothetical protein